MASSRAIGWLVDYGGAETPMPSGGRAEFDDGFRPHEIPYFQRFVEDDGQPALDVACGTGRLLLPYLRAGLDVDGCDVSADMIELCREKAEREGLRPNLYVQPMHELDLPRRYRRSTCAARSVSGARGSRTSQHCVAPSRTSSRVIPSSDLRTRVRHAGVERRMAG